MTEHQFEYLVELMTSPVEKMFLSALEADPDDEASRNAYMDFLRERSRDKTADLVQSGRCPGSVKVSSTWLRKFETDMEENTKKAQLALQQFGGGLLASGGLFSGSLGSGQVGTLHFASEPGFPFPHPPMPVQGSGLENWPYPFPPHLGTNPNTGPWTGFLSADPYEEATE